jgi:hypothetical protein
MPQIIDSAEIEKRFSHHVPNEVKASTHGDIREAYKEFAGRIAEQMPEGREKSLAFTALEESSFWAHAAVARSDPNSVA